MAVKNFGQQITGVLTGPGAIASAIAGGSIGLAGGAMLAGQRAEESGLPLSQQATSTLGGGLKGTITGAAVGYGGSVALSAAAAILRKK